MLDTDWLSGCDHVLTLVREAHATFFEYLELKLKPTTTCSHAFPTPIELLTC